MTSGEAAGWRRVRALVAELLEAPEEARSRRLAELDGEVGAELAAEIASLLAASAAGERLEERVLAGAASALASWREEEAGATAAPPSPVGLELGAWRLERQLGQGGMAEVWAASRIAGDYAQLVAVKILKRGIDSDENVRRFVRERQILARLDHRGIARLLDGGVTPDGRPYLVMERVEGRTLAAWCRERAVDLEGRLRLLIEIAEAVAAAHRLLVVHRDLKPSNILVAEDGTVKLLDFGIAKLLEDDAPDALATRTGVRLLTPSYAAPEQILGEPVTTATDVYALGIVAFELLTGRLPQRRWEGDLAAAVTHDVTERPSTAVLSAAAGEPEPENSPARRRWARALAGDLDTIVLTALRRDPARRYGSVAALADDLARFLSGRPIAARRDALAYRARKFIGRHRVATALGAAAAVTLFAASTAALVQARRAAREAASARVQAARAEQQATRAERVRAFLTSIFEVSDPTRSRGEQVTARALLDEGVRRVDAELAGENELRGEMLDLLAGLYRKLGAFAEGRGLAERSLALRVATSGAESAAAARSEWTLGWILVGEGEFAPAREHLEHAIAVLDRVEGPDSLAAADAREPLMELLFGAEGPQATLAVVERRLATYRRVLGERDERTARALSDLGAVQVALGNLVEAERSLRASAAVLDEVLPADDPRAAYPHNNLAVVLMRLDRPREGEAEARKAIAIRTKALGPGHPETIASRGQLTKALLALERYSEAEANARESLALLEGTDRFGASQQRAVLAEVLLEAKRYPEALATFDATLAERRDLLKPDHILVLGTEVNRARALEGLGRKAEALAALDRLIPRLEAKGAEGARALERARATRERLKG